MLFAANFLRGKHLTFEKLNLVIESFKEKRCYELYIILKLYVTFIDFTAASSGHVSSGRLGPGSS